MMSMLLAENVSHVQVILGRAQPPWAAVCCHRTHHEPAPPPPRGAGARPWNHLRPLG